MKKSVRIGRLFGIDVELHYSWFFIFVLFGYVLSKDFYPYYYPDFPGHVYWIIGFFSSFLLFFSVLFHEFMHSLVAKNNKIPVKKITLFLFGGIAQIHEKNMSPSKEIKTAIAGPLGSVMLAIIFMIISLLSLHTYVEVVAFYLVRLNLILAFFNLMPGFPLDGGRVFRAIVWHFTKDLKKATKMASTSGKVFGMSLGILGLLEIFFGNLGGLWLVLLGVFIFFLAEMSYEQMILGDILEKIKVADVLNTKFVIEKPESTVAEVIKKYSKKNINSILIGKGDWVAGVLDIVSLASLAPASINVVKVSDVCNKKFFKVKAEQNMNWVFIKMVKKKLPLIPVYKGKKLLGVVERDYILRYLKFKFNYMKE